MTMKKNLVTALALFCVFSAQAQQQIKHVVLITIDGLRPDFYLESGWQTPTLREMVQQGFHAEGVNSVFPSMTYPSHTTIVTGVQPVTHGVYYNDRFDPTGNGKAGNYWHDSSIHVPTLWSVLHQRGEKVASLYWPVSAGAPVDYDIPDVGSLGNSVRDAWAQPAGLMETLNRELFVKEPAGTSGDQRTARIAAWIIQKDAPALINMHFFAVDHFEHEQGRTGNLVSHAIADVDSAVAIVKEALVKKGIMNSTLLIVTGDHGFLTVTKTVNPNAWLHAAGLLNNRATGDWKAQFNYSGGAAWLYLKDPNDQATLQQIQQLYVSLPDSSKEYFRVIDRDALDRIGANPEVALALSATNGAAFGGKPDGAPFLPGKGGTHGYFPDFREIRTGFIAIGPGVKAGSMVQEMNLRDISAIVAEALNIPFPTGQGKVPEGLFSK